MTEEKIHLAIGKMIAACDAKMATGKYPMVSARSVLRELDYDASDQQTVLLHIAAGGFDYCLDHTIVMSGHHEGRGEKPDHAVCWWGPDQLASRLQCLSNVPYWVRHKQ